MEWLRLALASGISAGVVAGLWAWQSLRKSNEAANDSPNSELSLRLAAVERTAAEADAALIRANTELERIAGMTKPEAVRELTHQVVNEQKEIIREEAQLYAASQFSAIEDQAQRMLLEAMERSAGLVASESSTLSVPLPSEEIKGRLIGREGRNIKAFEQAAEVDLLIDNSQDAVTISSLNPIRREVARLALGKLLQSGKIQPTRIEEAVELAERELDQAAAHAGAEAAQRVGALGLHPEVLLQLGRLKFRASLGQNLLQHSLETAQIAAALANELQLDIRAAALAGLLHDIGKGLDAAEPKPHALAGMDFLAVHGIREPVLNAVGAHHREIEPTSPEALIVIIADCLSAARPGARREAIDVYAKRIASIEAIALAHQGVERAYAVQSGRELRVFVHPNQMDDQAAKRLANQLVSEVTAQVPHTTGLTITVIREFKVQAQSK